jgi:hypothetical protein
MLEALSSIQACIEVLNNTQSWRGTVRYAAGTPVK